MKYYAAHHHAGRGTRWADTGEPVIRLYAFDTPQEREAACLAYRAPNHCPTAAMEPVRSTLPQVRKARRCGIEIGRWVP